MRWIGKVTVAKKAVGKFSTTTFVTRMKRTEIRDCLPNFRQTTPLSADLSAYLDRLGIDEDESDHTRLAASIDPIVDRVALREHVAGFQTNNGVVKLHI